MECLRVSCTGLDDFLSSCFLIPKFIVLLFHIDFKYKSYIEMMQEVDKPLENQLDGFSDSEDLYTNAELLNKKTPNPETIAESAKTPTISESSKHNDMVPSREHSHPMGEASIPYEGANQTTTRDPPCATRSKWGWDNIVNAARKAADETLNSQFISNAKSSACHAISSVKKSEIVKSARENATRVASKTKESVDDIVDTFEEATLDGKRKLPPCLCVILPGMDGKAQGVVRKAFRQVFPIGHKLSVTTIQSWSGIAEEPVGHGIAVKGAEGLIQNCLDRVNRDLPYTVFVGIQDFCTSINGKWFYQSAVVLQDFNKGIKLVSFTPAITVPGKYIKQLDKNTCSEYEHRTTGFSSTLHSQIERLNPDMQGEDWRYALTNGQMRSEDFLLPAIRIVAGQYSAYVV